LGKKYLSWKIIGKTEQKKRQKSSKRKKKSEKIIWSFCFSPFPFLSLFVSVWFPSTRNQVLCGKKAERERERERESLCSQQNKHTFIETVV
jgi:hypothetical protein